MEKTVWKDEKDLTLDVPVNLQNDSVYGKGNKSDIPDKNLLISTNKMSKKFMVSAAISWYGVNKPFFVNNNCIKVNKENYCRHLRKKKLLNVMITQDRVLSNRSHLVQDFL